MQIITRVSERAKENPNIELVEIKLLDRPIEIISKRKRPFHLDSSESLAMAVTVYFKTPVLLEGKLYNRVGYMFDIVEDKCYPTFFDENDDVLGFYPKERTLFERFLRVVSRPEEMLTEEEIKERRGYQEP